MTSYPSAALWITGDLGLRGVVTTILPALVTWSSAKCSSNEVFIGAILKPLGRNDYKAISTHFDATPSSKEALQKYPEQSFAQKFGLCNRQKFSGRKIKEGF